ncbi:uncharacterized protein LOC132561938 [Ylistrum balloti]|uniref:uncharacterized protein LOC132561938 n=1 Tax=Ylistrum balloti TaxID=509963 RepID=UPI002905BFB5|nr:uncharacterized protein LOC132561938 [Ylistrum balloti]
MYRNSPMDSEQKSVQHSYASVQHSTHHAVRSISESSETELLPQVSRKNGRTCCCRIDHVILYMVITCIAICIVLSACVAFLFSEVADIDGKIERFGKKNEVKETICQQCNELKTGPLDDDDPNLLELDRKGDICCASSPKQIRIIVEMMYQRQKMISDIADDKKSNQSECCNHTTPSSANMATSGGVSAHLLVGLQRLKTTRNGQQPIRNWQTRDPSAHVEGLRLIKDKLVIPQKGLYLIYSQICFSVRDTGDFIHGNIPVLYHYVYRFNVIYPNGGTQLLLRSVNAEKIQPSWEFGDLTSYTSAALIFEKGDQVYVQVSNTSFVSRDPKASFFGIVKLN